MVFIALFLAANVTPKCAPEPAQDLKWARADLGASAERPIWMSLWGDFCKPCIEEMPRVKQLAKQLGFTLVFVGLGSDAKIAELTKKYDLSDPQAHTYSFSTSGDRLAGIFDAAKPFSFPQHVFFDRESKLRCRFNGTIEKENLAELKALAK